MANVKNAGVRELIIDECLRDQRGHSIKEMMELVNKALELEGLNPITSENSIRNDICNIANRWKQKIKTERRGHAIYFSYDDPTFSIFKCQFTRKELMMFHVILMNLKFLDAYQGSFLYSILSEALERHLQLRCYQLPFLMYEYIPTQKELENFDRLCEHIWSRTVVSITCQQGRAGPEQHTIHPYLMRQECLRWHLLGRNEKSQGPVRVPVRCILSVEPDKQTTFIPNTLFDVKGYYNALQKQVEDG